MSIASPVRTVLLTNLAMMASAANSLLTRLALEIEAIDAVSFATLRLTSGALALAAILLWRERRCFSPACDQATRSLRRTRFGGALDGLRRCYAVHRQRRALLSLDAAWSSP